MTTTLIQQSEKYSLENMLEKLESMEKRNDPFIFRGHSKSTFELKPYAFRKEVLAEWNKTFPIPNYHKWLISLEVQKNLKSFQAKDALPPLYLNRIFDITFYTMQYNYFLANFIQDKDHITFFDKKTIEMFHLREPEHWTKKETFNYILSFKLERAIARFTLNSEVINPSEIDEELAGYDDTLPQHYGVPTCALDWTYDPYIAIYFATRNLNEKNGFFSIFAYRQNSIIDNPISIETSCKEIKNPRIEQQKGLFTRFKYANRDYFYNGSWPKIENYVSKFSHKFQLIKFDFQPSSLPLLKNLLEKKRLNEQYLMPELQITQPVA